MTDWFEVVILLWVIFKLAIVIFKTYTIIFSNLIMCSWNDDTVYYYVYYLMVILTYAVNVHD
jgi:hypothetical protein